MRKGRSLARAIVLQSLFEIDSESLWGEDFKPVLNRNFDEFAGESKLYSYTENLLKIILAKKDEIDRIIEKAAPQWPLDRIATVDRNILRLGLAELLYADHDDVPHKVAINEAIELAKEFGGDNSYKFVNGVLGTVYVQMGQPGKDEKSKQELKEDVIAAFVYAEYEDNIYVALVHDIFGYWTLVKGAKLENETDEEALKRKVKEELGLELSSMENRLGESSYKVNKENKKILRCVTYYLVRSEFEDLKLKNDGGLDDAKWFKLIDMKDLRFYDDMIPIIGDAINILLNK